jgi:cytochrome P450
MTLELQNRCVLLREFMAEGFDPDRWLDQDEADLGKENGSWQPFEPGPRNCIGQQLALIEARVIAVLTVSFSFLRP